MRRIARRFAVTAGVFLAAGSIPVFAAAPASAVPSPYKCMKYLDDHGYVVGKKVEYACSIDVTSCVLDLQDLGVKQTHAVRACDN